MKKSSKPSGQTYLGRNYKEPQVRWEKLWKKDKIFRDKMRPNESHCEARWWKHHVVGMHLITRDHETQGQG